MTKHRSRLLPSVAGIARRRWPHAYAHARNWWSLGEWAGKRVLPGRGATDPYDQTFWDFHEKGDWAGLAQLIAHFFSPSSVVDVGCGQGLLLAALRSQNPELTLLGIETSSEGVRRARSRGLVISVLSLAFFGRRSSAEAAAEVSRFDLAVCLETAEHLPPWSAAGLISVLTRAPLVVFSAAQLGQGGTAHMNERPAAYWRSRFARRGYALDERDTEFRERVAALDLPWWYGANIHVFRRKP